MPARRQRRRRRPGVPSPAPAPCLRPPAPAARALPRRASRPLPGPAPAAAAAAAPSIRGPTQPLEKLIGRTLNNRYLVQDKIGEGGFGAVFEGQQVATGRAVALKILHPHNVPDRPWWPASGARRRRARSSATRTPS